MFFDVKYGVQSAECGSGVWKRSIRSKLIIFENEVKLSVENTPFISTFTINSKTIINFKILIKIFILIIKLF
jgi:hypothetical protein